MFVFKAAVVGAGTMGGEIAQAIASSDISVVLKDIDQEFVDDGLVVLLDDDPLDERHRFLEVFECGPGGGVGPDLEGNEAPPAEGGAFEVIDRPDAVRLVFHHDILELLAQDRLDGGLVLLGHADMVGDEPQE